MRRHDRFARLAPRIDGSRFAQVVGADHLIAARLDPGFLVDSTGEALLDLIFRRDGCIAVVPFVLVSGGALLSYEKNPFSWPSWLPPLRSATADAIETRLEPWLRSLTIGRFLNAECVRRFGDDGEGHRIVDEARAAGFLGAAPTETVMHALAPYVYALRFAAGKRIAIADRDGANGAALLARIAGRVEADVGDSASAQRARGWFGLDVFGAGVSDADCDVAVGSRADAPPAPVRIVLGAPSLPGERRVDVAQSIPPNLMVSFDTNDGDAVRSFAVAAPETPPRNSALAAVRVVGGSAGRIAVVVRGDFRSADDADVDAARALAARLEEQGFTPSVVSASHVEPARYDLMHVVGVSGAQALCAKLESENARTPLVVTPFVDATAGAPSGPARQLLARARAAVVAGAEEEARLRERFAFTGVVRAVPALLGPHAACLPVDTLVGDAPYAFVHAPVERRCGQVALARAARALGYAIVFAGPVVDADYYVELTGAFGDAAVWLPSERLEAGELAALYARARVFADATGGERGAYRLARAAAFGCTLLASERSDARWCWPSLVQTVDETSGDSVAAGLRSAWERADRLGSATAAFTAERYDPFAALVAVLATYQAAAAAVN